MKIDFSPCEISDLSDIFSALSLVDLPFLSKAQVEYFRYKFDSYNSYISEYK